MSATNLRTSLGLLYGSLTVFCFLSYWIPAWHGLVTAHLGLVCLLGPAAWLIYGLQYIIVFVIGTAVCLFFVAGGLFVFTGWQKVVCLLSGVLSWLSFGVMGCGLAV